MANMNAIMSVLSSWHNRDTGEDRLKQKNVGPITKPTVISDYPETQEGFMLLTITRKHTKRCQKEFICLLDVCCKQFYFVQL
jgi:hypothetical protein